MELKRYPFMWMMQTGKIGCLQRFFGQKSGEVKENCIYQSTVLNPLTPNNCFTKLWAFFVCMQKKHSYQSRFLFQPEP